jgi:murein DD-endopeptidase MepM/ murein hydrolase activator NlpD
MRTELPFVCRQSRTLRLGGQLSLVALLAGLGAGCSGSPFSLKEPVFTGSTANQQAILSGQAGGSAGASSAYVPTAGVQSSDLPPPPGAASPSYTPAPAYAAAPSPPPYTPPAPYAAAGLPTPVGQVSGAPAASPPGQTLAQLGAAPASLNEQAARIGGGSAAGGTHTVQSGDTMYNIARRYGVSVNALISENGGSSVARLGQKVVIPGGGAGSQPEPRVQTAAVDPQSMPAPAPAVLSAPPPIGLPPAAGTLTPPAPAPVGQQVALAPQTGAAAAQAPAAPQPSATAPAQDASGFRWPVRGRVISEFGKKPNGERNDGINLAVPEGTAVKAAEDGTVIYSGNELKSYGNLVLVRHENGWVSAYAHNSELKVKRGEQVRRGQIVALSGMSGGVTTPQVHFELRKDATPVNPLQHMTES